MGKVIPVVSATDENYAMYCGVMIYSLIRNADPTHQYEIFVLYDRLSERSLHRLQSLGTVYATITCICVHEWMKDFSIKIEGHLTIATLYRFLIPELLPQYDKVVYLDCDIIINSDIAELFMSDIGDYYVAGVLDYGCILKTQYLCSYLNEKNLVPDQYINAGVLVMNTAQFRAYGLSQKGMNMLTGEESFLHYDQDVLNILCRHHIYYLPLKWNVMWGALQDPANCESYLNHDKLHLNCLDSSIIHYASQYKPWNHLDYKYGMYFWQYAMESGYFTDVLCKLKKEVCCHSVKTAFELTSSQRKKIAVYGAGLAGLRYVTRCLELDCCEIVAWVDREYMSKTDLPLPVVEVERIYQVDFDLAVITIRDAAISNQVKEMLMDHGIPEEKILQQCRL